MSSFEAFRYDGKRALVVGGATGMGAATAELVQDAGAETIVMDFDAAAQWAQDHLKTDYMFSKQAVCAYVAREAMALLKQGIRINAICPGPTDTPLAQANSEMWLGFGSDYRAAVGIEASTPL